MPAPAPPPARPGWPSAPAAGPGPAPRPAATPPGLTRPAQRAPAVPAAPRCLPGSHRPARPLRPGPRRSFPGRGPPAAPATGPGSPTGPGPGRSPASSPTAAPTRPGTPVPGRQQTPKRGQCVRYSSPEKCLRLVADRTLDKPYPPRSKALSSFTLIAAAYPGRKPEVKTNRQRRSPAQLRRIAEAQQALRDLGPLPGDNPGERLYDLEVDFKTHLPLLATGTERAARDGIFAVKVPGDRALIVVDLYGCSAQGWTHAEFVERLARQHSAVLRRAGIGGEPEYNVSAMSLDSVARAPLRVPFAAYPLHPT